MNSLDRVSISLKHQEPDRVPFLNLLTVHGAQILHMTYPEYYQKPENIVLGQERLRELFHHDCLFPYYYGGHEIQAFGGRCVFNQHGPPQAGSPPFHQIPDILSFELPDPFETHPDQLRATELLAQKWNTEVPILNAVIAPLSLGVLLFGFKPWIEMIVSDPVTAKKIIQYLLPYTINYANALLEKGATSIAYANPLASPQMMRLSEYESLSFESDRTFFSKIHGSALFGTAGAKVEPLIPYIKEMGAIGVGISAQDNLWEIKKKWGKNLVLVGNLNNVAMVRWSTAEVDHEVKSCCEAAMEGGGYILTDQQGDLPEAVQFDTISQIYSSVIRWGTYGRH